MKLLKLLQNYIPLILAFYIRFDLFLLQQGNQVLLIYSLAIQLIVPHILLEILFIQIGYFLFE